MAGFDIAGAHKAGYSDAEIADYMGKQASFDVTGARKAGYDDNAIISHLTKPKEDPPHTWGDELGIGVRAAEKGVTDLWDLVANSDVGPIPLRGANMVLKSLRSDPATIVANSGLPKPVTNREKLASSLIEGGVAGAPFGGGAGIPAALVSGASGAGGAASGEFARQQGFSPVNQFLASLAGGGFAGLTTGRVANAFTKVPVPTAEALRTQATAAYTAAEHSGVTFNPSAVQALQADVMKDLATHPNIQFHPDLHPRIKVALTALDDLASSNQPPSFQQMELLRRVAKTAGRSADADERRLGRNIVSKLDDFVQNAGPNEGSGDTAGAAAAITQARSAWSRMAKSDQISEMIEKARNSPSSSAVALKAQFRQLANNPNRMRQFTPQEQAAIKQMARGTVTQNALQIIGNLSPGMNMRGMFAGYGEANLALHNPLLAGGLAVGGATGKVLANRMAAGRAQNVAVQMRNGEPMGVDIRDLVPFMTPAMIQAAEAHDRR